MKNPLKPNIPKQIEAAKFLFEQGSHLIRCGTKVSPKAPIAKAWQTKRDTLSAITKHLEAGKLVGMIPSSNNILAIDIDSPTPEKSKELLEKTTRILGTDGQLCISPSLSSYENGSGHAHALWLVPPNPLGTQDGKPILKRNNLHLDGDKELKFDMLYSGSQIVIPDLTIIANALRDKPATTCSRMLDLCERGRRKQPASNNHALPLNQPAISTGIDPDRMRETNDNLLAKVQIGSDPDAENEGNNGVVYSLGKKAGSERNWNPWLEQQARDFLQSRGMERKRRWQQFDEGISAGIANPTRPEDVLKPAKLAWICKQAKSTNGQPQIQTHTKDAPLPSPPPEVVSHGSQEEEPHLDDNEPLPEPSAEFLNDLLEDEPHGSKRPKNPTNRFPFTHLETSHVNDRIREACEAFQIELRHDTILEAIQFREKKGPWIGLEEAHLADILVGMEDACRVSTSKQVDDGEGKKKWKRVTERFTPGPANLKRNLYALAARNPYDAITDFMSRIKDYNTAWGNPCEDLREKFGIAKNKLNKWCMFIMFAPAYYFNSREDPKPVRPTPIVTGDQDTGKTQMIKVSIYPDLQARLHSGAYRPDASAQKRTEAVVGKLLAELPEMQKWSGRQLDDHKMFSQQTVDTGVRLSYRRNVGDYKRTCWMIGTANRPDCLPDDDSMGQGNTRFVVLEATKGFDVEAWFDAVRDDMPGAPTNRDRLWAYVKHETERILDERGSLRMEGELRDEHAKNIDKNQNVQETMQHALIGATWEIEHQWQSKRLGYDTPQDDKDFREDYGYSLSEIIQTNSFKWGFLGGRTEFSRRESKSLDTRVGAALKKTPILWTAQKKRVPGEGVQRRYFRSGASLPLHAAIYARDKHGDPVSPSEADLDPKGKHLYEHKQTTQ